ncbi:hypothetical protein ACFQHV_01100 [Promicromonospora thailandica]|uniref:Uncharacterized protein n=1 Tax=Promicromonospora thailandica TaxID=765201 RepID=A0A9X2JYZ4_9MICO|nr:hypothetical protein [Promicromonospora thailandica]MCP2265549.1 hypothetical protein [Promicromonospora thailandica]BFF17114.1 hypothetical protein GCM10025730_06350 [Promicromonospora thailandica]
MSKSISQQHAEALHAIAAAGHAIADAIREKPSSTRGVLRAPGTPMRGARPSTEHTPTKFDLQRRVRDGQIDEQIEAIGSRLTDAAGRFRGGQAAFESPLVPMEIADAPDIDNVPVAQSTHALMGAVVEMHQDVREVLAKIRAHGDVHPGVGLRANGGWVKPDAPRIVSEQSLTECVVPGATIRVPDPRLTFSPEFRRDLDEELARLGVRLGDRIRAAMGLAPAVARAVQRGEIADAAHRALAPWFTEGAVGARIDASQAVADAVVHLVQDLAAVPRLLPTLEELAAALAQQYGDHESLEAIEEPITRRQYMSDARSILALLRGETR